MDRSTLRWTALVLELGGEEGRPLWLEHPEHGGKVDIVAYPLAPNPEQNLDLIARPTAGPARASGHHHRTLRPRLPVGL
jgi:hypothetical protein